MMAKRADDSVVVPRGPSAGGATVNNVDSKLAAAAAAAGGGGDAASSTDGASTDDGGSDELVLEEILKLYNQPINEEQAWAVCYQCCSFLGRRESPGGECGRPVGRRRRRLESAAEIRICRDGTIAAAVQPETGSTGKSGHLRCTDMEVIESLGILIYKALDYGLKETEERELSPPLEQLIDRMTNITEEDGDTSKDEGYEAQDEEEEGEDFSTIRAYKHIMKLCAMHLPTPSEASNHYQAVCRALFTETLELQTFLAKIQSAKENLRKMQEMDRHTRVECSADLDVLKNTDWACLWVQVMRDLRNGVKLKKVHERQYNPLPFEYQLTPYEMLMDDIRSKRYTLRKVMVNGDIPPKLKKSAHEVILDFIRSRPPLNPVSARKLKPTPPRPRSLHERILEEIKAERKLRPVSPDEIRRSRLDVSTPEARRKLMPTSVANGSLCPQTRLNGVGAAQVTVQRKKLLKAPTLAELDSSDSEEEASCKTSKSSNVSSFQVEEMKLHADEGKKMPPLFLPISSTPQPERKQPPQRRHSIEKETPTNVRQFLPPSKQSSKSLEEFCYPVECLALTVEEVMHIRQVLVKAELEKYQQYKDVYHALKKGKLCFCCRAKRFSFFTWSYTCQFCKRPVCSQCCRKMRLPSKPYSSLPIYSLGPSALQRGDSGSKSEKQSSSLVRQRSLQKSASRTSSQPMKTPEEELQFPKELMEDWNTMIVCVDCKKFISEIISSSRRTLVLANKRARLKRKTQSFYMSSPSTSDYRPSERTINEI
ncbi:protein spire homolog 1-like isoform X2 [Latimeria chalumnae]|uniref:protein spire homolog 1-like isoform X2 n=1 Tax=Latimeria chalumnae TaxID=7897 RepID=UPI00313D3E50